MNFQKIFVRVVPADKDRGYILLTGFDNKLVIATCAQYSTLSTISRRSLDAAIERMRVEYNAAEVKDITAPAITRKLQKLFGEPIDAK